MSHSLCYNNSIESMTVFITNIGVIKLFSYAGRDRGVSQWVRAGVTGLYDSEMGRMFTTHNYCVFFARDGKIIRLPFLEHPVRVPIIVEMSPANTPLSLSLCPSIAVKNRLGRCSEALLLHKVH